MLGIVCLRASMVHCTIIPRCWEMINEKKLRNFKTLQKIKFYCYFVIIIIISSRMHICFEVHKRMLKSKAIFKGIESWGHFGLMEFNNEDIEINKWMNDSHWD